MEEGNARPEDLFEIIWTDSSAYRELRSQVTASFAQGKLVCPGTEVSDLFESTATKAAEDEGRETASLDLSLAPWPVTLPQRYEVLQELGRGGMGVVYKAHDRETGEILAVKVLKPDIAGDPAGMERFKNELRLATTLVEEMATTLSEIDTTDNYHEALKQLIDSKIKGKKVAEFEVEELPRLDIMSALKKSLQQSNRKPMVKATTPSSKKKALTLVKTADKAAAKQKVVKKRKAS